MIKKEQLCSLYKNRKESYDIVSDIISIMKGVETFTLFYSNIDSLVHDKELGEIGTIYRKHLLNTLYDMEKDELLEMFLYIKSVYEIKFRNNPKNIHVTFVVHINRWIDEIFDIIIEETQTETEYTNISNNLGFEILELIETLIEWATSIRGSQVLVECIRKKNNNRGDTNEDNKK